MITIGVVVDTFGLQGEVKVKSLASDNEIFTTITSVTITTKSGSSTQKKVLSVRFHKDVWLVKLEGIDNPEDAVLLKTNVLQVPFSELPPADEDEVYWFDIEGAQVVDIDGNEVGILVDYIETGSSDVFQITGADGLSYLISNNPSHVLNIDKDSKTITVEPSGLVAENATKYRV